MLRSFALVFLLALAAAPSCSDLPDVVEPKPGGAGNGAGAPAGAGAAGKAGGAAAGKGGSGDNKRDAGSDEDAGTED